MAEKRIYNGGFGLWKTKRELYLKPKVQLVQSKEYWSVPPKGKNIPYKEVAALSGAGFGVHWATLLASTIGLSGITDSDVWEDQMEAQSIEHNKAFTSGVLEDNIIAVLDKYDFDSVNFDYEYPLSLNAWHYYNNFLVSLDKKLGDYTLGVADNDWNIKFTSAAIRAIDTFEVMLYDMIDEEGRHATYEDTVKAVQEI